MCVCVCVCVCVPTGSEPRHAVGHIARDSCKRDPLHVKRDPLYAKRDPLPTGSEPRHAVGHIAGTFDGLSCPIEVESTYMSHVSYV